MSQSKNIKMNKILLSILIPTVVGREKEFEHLVWNTIRNQSEFNILINDRYGQFEGGTEMKHQQVEILYLKDNKEITIGEKRENLYKLANGLYSWMIDDDDSIAPNAIELIIKAIKENPNVSCITFKEKCLINGVYKSSNHSIKYDKWQDNFDGYDFVRCPFYKDVIRTDIAKSVPFNKVRWNEDEQQSMALKPFLNNEVHIEEELYYYIYNETDPIERYGLNK